VRNSQTGGVRHAPVAPYAAPAAPARQRLALPHASGSRCRGTRRSLPAPLPAAHRRHMALPAPPEEHFAATEHVPAGDLRVAHLPATREGAELANRRRAARGGRAAAGQRLALPHLHPRRRRTSR